MRATPQVDSSLHGGAWEAGRKALRGAWLGFRLLSVKEARWGRGCLSFLGQILTPPRNDSATMRLLTLLLLATGASATCQRDPRGNTVGGSLGRCQNSLR